MSKPSDGGPAFPQMKPDHVNQAGMSLRDWFAGQALAGLMAYSGETEGAPVPIPMWNMKVFAAGAYAAADAMLAERDKGAKP